MSRRSGFTLIELLVVIAIIAILAAILFPVFAAAKASGNQAKCLNNVKQITGATIMYSGDYYGSMLPGFVSSTWGTWYESLNPYLKQMRKAGTGYDLRGIWLCPNIPHSVYPNGTEIPSDLKRCYGYNYAYLGGYPIPNTNPVEYDFRKSGDLVKSSRTICVLEVWSWDKVGQASKGWGTAYCYPPHKVARLCQPDMCWPPGWHSGRSVVGWCDGHVSTVKLIPPQPGNSSYPANLHTGNTNIMQEYHNDVPTSSTDENLNTWDPWFRTKSPKP